MASGSGSDTSSERNLPPPYEEEDGKGQFNKGYQHGDDVIVSVIEKDKKLGDEDDGVTEEDDPWTISEVYIEVTPWADLSAVGKVKRVVWDYFQKIVPPIGVSLSLHDYVYPFSTDSFITNVSVTTSKELSTSGKIKRVLWDYFMKIVLLIGFLYLFICSLDFLGSAFQLISGKTAGNIFSQNEILGNPVAGLLMGVLITVLVQSSSTTTSIIVSMVASNIISVKKAIPMVMGANIGTSVTNTLVSIGQISNKRDFRRAFAGATVHDMFNWLTVFILLPLEVLTHYLYRLTELIVNSMHLETNESADQEFLKKITHPFTHLIVQVDKKVIQGIAHNDEAAMNKSLIKHCCVHGKRDETLYNVTSGENYTDMVEFCEEKCKFLFEGVADKWSDTTIGVVLLVFAIFLLCVCLVLVVKILNSLMKGKVSVLIKKFVNANFPGPLAYFTGYLAIIIGTGLTILVQSSSVFTSTLTPLVGIGVIQIDRMYPLTLGANIGTTTTTILAALAQDSNKIKYALQIAFCHLFFNLSGIVLFYPIPQLRFPIRMAKFLGDKTAEYRWFAVMYLIVLFFILPGTFFALSIVSWQAMVGVLAPVIFLVILVVIMNILQSKCPNCLPKALRTWDFLPEPCRSLAPYDRILKRLCGCCSCCRDVPDVPENDEEISVKAEKDEKESERL